MYNSWLASQTQLDPNSQASFLKITVLYSQWDIYHISIGFLHLCPSLDYCYRLNYLPHPPILHLLFKVQLKCKGLCSLHQRTIEMISESIVFCSLHQVFLIYTHHLVQTRHALRNFEIWNQHKMKSPTWPPKSELRILHFISHCRLLVFPCKGVGSRLRLEPPPNGMHALGLLQSTHGNLNIFIS